MSRIRSIPIVNFYKKRSIIHSNKDLDFLSDNSLPRKRKMISSLSLSLSFSFYHFFLTRSLFLRRKHFLSGRDTTAHTNVACHFGIKYARGLNTEGSRQSPMRSLTIGDFAHGNSLPLIWYFVWPPYLEHRYRRAIFHVDKLSSRLPLPCRIHEDIFLLQIPSVPRL